MSRRRLLALGGLATGGLALGCSSRSTPAATGDGPLLVGRVVNARLEGARGDGVADDGPALRRALAAVGPEGGTVFLPAGTYRMQTGLPLFPSPGTVLAGDPGRTTIRVDPTAAGYTEFCRPTGDRVILDGLTVERVTDVPTVLLPVGAVHDLTLSRTAFVGHTDTLRTEYCHGIQLGVAGGAGGRLRLQDVSMTTMTYGLFQTNASNATTDGIVVTGSTFRRGANTDLEFNGPAGAISNVTVEGCTFGDNLSAGFGVGLALVRAATIRGCSFDGYAMEAVHLEDYSQGVVIRDNTFSACGLARHSHIQVISGSRDIQVLGNTFRATTNVQPIHCVNALPGGEGTTASGRPVVGPSEVTVRDNSFELASSVGAVFLAEVDGSTVTGNRVSGPGSAPTDGAAGPSRVFTLLGGSPQVSDNEIAGQRY